MVQVLCIINLFNPYDSFLRQMLQFAIYIWDNRQREIYTLLKFTEVADPPYSHGHGQGWWKTNQESFQKMSQLTRRKNMRERIHFIEKNKDPDYVLLKNLGPRTGVWLKWQCVQGPKFNPNTGKKNSGPTLCKIRNQMEFIIDTYYLPPLFMASLYGLCPPPCQSQAQSLWYVQTLDIVSLIPYL